MPLSSSRLALLSVTDKSGLVPFARGLVALGYELLSTGGTAKLLREHDVPVADVATYTGSPEILDGRVKTLHPKIHGGILYDRAQAAHVDEAAAHGIRPIDLVVVNLYRFAAEAVAKQLSREAAIEHIDIGGPTMLRAAAKNWLHATPLLDPSDYPEVLRALQSGGLSRPLRQRLAAKTFAAISAYDQQIAAYLSEAAADSAPASLGASLPLELRKVQDLRYGENPHQMAGLYVDSAKAPSGLGHIQLLSGKELSYNNILDLDAATALVREFTAPAVVIVKHTNPCGVAVGVDGDMASVFKAALACDPKSAFGGIIALNRPVDEAAALAITALFTECVAAPEFSAEALAIFQKKPNLRVLQAPYAAPSGTQQTKNSQPTSLGAADLHLRSVRGAFLVQEADAGHFDAAAWTTVTKVAPTASQRLDLELAMIIAKHVKSNAIVFVKDGVSVAIGAGQMSRVDAANTAVAKAAEQGRSIKGSVMSSDAFFPFRDTVDFAAAQGVAAIVQPGGSKRDGESIAAADAHGIAMMITGERHFRH